MISDMITSLTLFFEGGNSWIVQLLLVVLATILLNFLVHRFIFKLIDDSSFKATAWTKAVTQSMRRPLSALVWFVGVGFAAQIISNETHAVLSHVLGMLSSAGVIGALVWFLVRFIKHGEEIFCTREDPEGRAPDRRTVETIGKLLRLIVLISAAMIMLQTSGFSVSGILTFGGIGGIALGLASKDLLANFFGGLMIYLDSPFSVGDWVRSPDRKIEGTVEMIGWRLTRIRTFDKRPLYVPNSAFLNIVVENPSRMMNRRINETIGVRYQDVKSVRLIVAQVKEMLMEHPAIDTDSTLMVNFNKFGGSSLDFFIYCFTKTTNWAEFHGIKEDVLLKIADIIEGCGAELAIPAQRVHLSEPLVKE